MMRLNYKKTAIIQFAFASLTMIGFAGHAAAQDATAPDPNDPNAAPAAEEEAASTSRYPRSVIARPLTLPKGLVMIGADLRANADFDVFGATPIVGYGITDDFEFQIPYSFLLEPFDDAKGLLNIDLGYKLLRGAAGGKLEMIARARAGYNLVTELADDLRLGVHVQYNVTPQLTILSGAPGTQQFRIAVDGADGAAKPIDFSLPLGVGFQATPELYLQLDTQIATIDISDSANAIIFDDATPVSLTAVYNAIPALDLQATVGFTDVIESPDDNVFFQIGARYYIGDL